MYRISLAIFALVVVVHPARADEPVVEDPPAEPAPPPTGTVKGRIVDPNSKEGLPAATIQVRGGSDGDKTLQTELDGTYAIVLPAGTYTIAFFTPDYVEQKRAITIVEGQTLEVSLELAQEVKAGKDEKIVVESTIDTRKASAVLAERRAAATVSDAVSAEQIARSPDSNASDAAKRMVAATIQDNRYIVIRGLGGRYSVTLLNGVPLPSPDPDIPAAPLDLFPASLITNLTVHKTFAPDMPGNFAGGALGIETRNYPTKFLFKAKVGMAGDSESTFRRLNGYDGGSLDLLGFDDGTRALPSVIPSDKLAGDAQLSPEQRNAQIAAFNDSWNLRGARAIPNLSLGASLGDTVKVGGKRLGYFTSLSFGHGYTQRATHIARPGGDDGAGGKLPSLLQLDDHQGIEQANLGALAAAGYAPASGHKLDAFALYAHTADITASEVTGTDNTATALDRTRLSFVERELAFGQLVGEHRVTDKAILEWQSNVARVAQHEPDTRDLLRTQTPDGRFAISNSAGAAERLYGELADTTFGGAASIRLPFERIKWKAGGSVQYSAREYQARRFHFDIVGDAAFAEPNEAFSPSGAGMAMRMYEATVPSDGYTATRLVAGGFAMADIDVVDKLRVVAGARFELADLDVGLDSKIDLMASPQARTAHNDRDLLPSVNAVYALASDTNLRAAYAMTVARPNFREIAPALYFDYVRRRAVGGNPMLDETHIHNADLRVETFLGESEVLAASVFGKRFASPIERTVESGGDGDNVGFSNAPTAITYGAELEARISLRRITPALAAFSVGGNLSVIGSRIDIGGGATRTLQGQSPYVANLGVGYEAAEIGLKADVLYNTFGRRIEEVGTGGSGNIYEEPFHRLDLVLAQRLPRNLTLKLAGSNLLGQRVVRTQDGVEIFAYQVGRTVVGSLELSIH